jgi:hypothetical protein
MTLTGEVFRQVDMPRAVLVHCSIAQPDFHLTRESDYVLPTRCGMPIAEMTRLSLTEDDAFGSVEGSQVRVGFQV